MCACACTHVIVAVVIMIASRSRAGVLRGILMLGAEHGVCLEVVP